MPNSKRSFSNNNDREPVILVYIMYMDIDNVEIPKISMNRFKYMAVMCEGH